MMGRFAEGTRELDTGSRTYRICIRYREPEYERRTRPRDQPFRYTFTKVASSKSAAIDAAVEEFREVERLSSVCWAREIVGIEVIE